MSKATFGISNKIQMCRLTVCVLVPKIDSFIEEDTDCRKLLDLKKQLWNNDYPENKWFLFLTTCKILSKKTRDPERRETLPSPLLGGWVSSREHFNVNTPVVHLITETHCKLTLQHVLNLFYQVGGNSPKKWNVSYFYVLKNHIKISELSFLFKTDRKKLTTSDCSPSVSHISCMNSSNHRNKLDRKMLFYTFRDEKTRAKKVMYTALTST